eukprot:GILI01048961.1.p1 GENE.GILI01048961.1~~GILI01048961.1.p1  ORF type:complete len:346 (+),score=62.04 GILI01048961.1:57-1040(+)
MTSIRLMQSAPLQSASLFFSLFCLLLDETTLPPSSFTTPLFHSSSNVCIDPQDKKVYKSFDFRFTGTEAVTRRTYNNLRFLPGASLLFDPFSKKTVLLVYELVEGLHEPLTCADLIGAMDALSVLHNLHLAHADVRLSNIIFCGNGKVVFIDLDFAGFHGKDKYPFGFRLKLHDCTRHPDVEEGAVMRQEHDLFSLGDIVASCVWHGAAEQRGEQEAVVNQALLDAGAVLKRADFEDDLKNSESFLQQAKSILEAHRDVRIRVAKLKVYPSPFPGTTTPSQGHLDRAKRKLEQSSTDDAPLQQSSKVHINNDGQALPLPPAARGELS